MIHKMVAWRFLESHQLPLHGFAPEMFAGVSNSYKYETKNRYVSAFMYRDLCIMVQCLTMHVQHAHMHTHTHTNKQTYIIIIINPLTARVVGAPQMIFKTSFLHLSLFSIDLWDLPNSRPVHSLMFSSHLFLCPPCLLPPFTVPCKMVLARSDERET